MITYFCYGCYAQRRIVTILWCLFYSCGVRAWQEDYIAGDRQSGPRELYTWDSTRQPRYEDILAERVKSQENTLIADDWSTAGMGWYWSGYGLTDSPGWRLEAGFGVARPWVQISYNLQPGDSEFYSVSERHLLPIGAKQGSGVDVSVGADMPINKSFSARASLSQSDGLMNSGEEYIYNIGVSAKF